MVHPGRATNFLKHNFGLKKLIDIQEYKRGLSSKAIPSDGLPIVGSMFSLMASGSSPKLHLYIDAKHKKLGPIFREVLPSRSTIFLSDPDKIRQVFSLEGKYPNHFLPESWLKYNKMYSCKRGLLFMEGEEWLHYRKLMNKFLIKDDIVGDLSKVYEEIATSLVLKWKPFTDQCILNLERDMYMHSLSFMMATAMGSSFIQHQSSFQSDMENLASSYQKIFNATSKLMVVPVQLVSYLNLPPWKSFASAVNQSLSGSEAVISKMMKISSGDGLIKKLVDAGVSENMLSVLLIDLMIAAGDTTSFTMQWALYHLGLDNGIQKDVISDRELVKGVIKEALRLYPAAPFLTRVIQQPLEAFGYHIPAGELIVMSMYTCGRTESNFPNASQFKPSRWSRDTKGRVVGVTNKFASLPFSMGTRSCVGKKLAEALMTITLTKILEEFKLTTVKQVDMVLRMIPAPAESIEIHIDSR